MRMPERRERAQEERLPVRECLQVRLAVQVQDRLAEQGRSRIVRGGRFAARAGTRSAPKAERSHRCITHRVFWP